MPGIFQRRRGPRIAWGDHLDAAASKLQSWTIFNHDFGRAECWGWPRRATAPEIDR